jgi:aspartyl/asparaginyl-tRNA synthetase
MYLIKNMMLPSLLVLFFLSSCVTSIKRIEKNPTRFQGKKVIVKGRVISSLDLKEINCFTIRDKSAKILVVTDNMLPLKNDKIKVKGIVEQQYQYKNQSFIVIKEKKLKLRKPPRFKNILEKL